MLKKTAKHIHRFRVYFLLAITAAFLYYAQLNPISIGEFMGAKMGRSIGMSVSVPENPFNKLAMQLQEKSELLDQREAELAVREADLAQGALASQRKLLIIVASGIVALFVLILLNFYYDWRRERQ